MKGNSMMLDMIRRLSVVIFSCAALFLLSGLAAPLHAQSPNFDDLLESGEFSLALQVAEEQTDPGARDFMLGQLARAQRQSQTGLSGFRTAAMISDDESRYGVMGQMLDYQNYGSTGFGGRDGANFDDPSGGQAGGITEQDFTELMDLLQETIDPDSWEINGGTGRMRPFPAGVFVDSSGTLKRIQQDQSGRLDRMAEAPPAELDENYGARSTELRKISLSRLERELQLRAAMGKPVSSEMKHLAGIYQLRYVMLYPETRDVVIAGPAGPWHYDETGRAINTETGSPVLNLDDLVVCLRNARRNGGQFSCSIDPREENLVAAKSFVETSQLKGRAFRDKLQEILGKMDVMVEGIEPSSHAARVIVEADYRMKLAGLGLEPTVSGLKNYFERIHLDDRGQLPSMDQLVRWWFTMDYDNVQANADRTVFELNGQGVKLLSESEFWNEQGYREHTGRASAAARGFAQDFTRRFDEVVHVHPIYGELKNLFDCAIAASLIHRESLNRQIDWSLKFLDGTTRPGELSYQLERDRVPRQVDSILGQRVLTHRVGNRTLRHTVSGFGGGVIFEAAHYASSDQIEVSDRVELQTALDHSQPESRNWRDWTWD